MDPANPKKNQFSSKDPMLLTYLTFPQQSPHSPTSLPLLMLFPSPGCLSPPPQHAKQQVRALFSTTFRVQTPPLPLLPLLPQQQA